MSYPGGAAITFQAKLGLEVLYIALHCVPKAFRNFLSSGFECYWLLYLEGSCILRLLYLEVVVPRLPTFPGKQLQRVLVSPTLQKIANHVFSHFFPSLMLS